MSTFSVTKMIGHTLVATKDVIAYTGHPLSNIKQTIPKGAIIGTVYSWVHDPQDAGNVYWMFPKKYYPNTYLYVKHDVNKLKLSTSDDKIPSNEEDAKKREEEKKMEDEGIIPYYIEKYGKVALKYTVGTIIGIAIIKAGVNALANRNK